MPNQQELGTMLNTYGVNVSADSFSFAAIMAYVIFGIIGLCAFNYGRKEKAYQPIVLGIALMVYPYLVRGTLWLYVIGVMAFL